MNIHILYNLNNLHHSIYKIVVEKYKNLTILNNNYYYSNEKIDEIINYLIDNYKNPK